MTGGADGTEAWIAARLSAAGIHAPSDVLLGSAAYLKLLERWNRRMNLTALPLTEPIPQPSIDKLIVEPLIAAMLLGRIVPSPAADWTWVDLGSGGGSPALPFRLACKSGSLTLVESRERKCAFLREAVRLLGLPRTNVVNARFENYAPTRPANLITVRAVRIDSALVELMSAWMRSGGILMCFGASVSDSKFQLNGERPLPDGSSLTAYRRV